MKLIPTLKLFKVIADETRLKIIVLLEVSEFTVSEMVQILELHQSNISRHLNQLRDAELVTDRRDGTLVFNRWSDKLRQSIEIQNILREAWQGIPGIESLRLKIEEVLNTRRAQTQEFFDDLAGEYHNLMAPGGGAYALMGGLAHCLSAEHAVDIGCGEGELTLLLAKSCHKVSAVDLSPKMLSQVTKRAKELNLDNVRTAIGDIDALPFEDQSTDLVFMSQVLHHSPQPQQAIKELDRIIAPQGRFVIIDLIQHQQEWMREKLGDLWLGFNPEDILKLVQEHQFHNVKLEKMSIEGGLPLFLITGTKK